MTWIKVIFRLDEIPKALDLPNRAWLRAMQNSYPKDFVVYSGFEFDRSIEHARFVLYFTPKAADDCEDILKDPLKEYRTEPCEEPDRNAPYFATAYNSQPPTPFLDFTHETAKLIAS